MPTARNKYQFMKIVQVKLFRIDILFTSSSNYMAKKAHSMEHGQHRRKTPHTQYRKLVLKWKKFSVAHSKVTKAASCVQTKVIDGK